MSTVPDYQSLVKKYTDGVRVVKKLGTGGMLIQFGIIGFINAWKHLKIEYYGIAALLFLSLSFSYILKDFVTTLGIEQNLNQIILEGVHLEKKESNRARFFHNILQDFSLVKVLAQRSLINLIAFLCFGYFFSIFINDEYPAIAISQEMQLILPALFTALTSAFYYNSLKTLAETKAKVFAN